MGIGLGRRLTLGDSGTEMTHREDKGLINVSDVNQRAPINLYRPGPARSSSPDRLHLTQCGGNECVTDEAALSLRSTKCFASQLSV